MEGSEICPFQWLSETISNHFLGPDVFNLCTLFFGSFCKVHLYPQVPWLLMKWKRYCLGRLLAFSCLNSAQNPGTPQKVPQSPGCLTKPPTHSPWDFSSHISVPRCCKNQSTSNKCCYATYNCHAGQMKHPRMLRAVLIHLASTPCIAPSLPTSSLIHSPTF